MNVTSNSQALTLPDTALPTRSTVRVDRVDDSGSRKQVTVFAPSDTTLVLIRGDRYSRTDPANQALSADVSYSDSRASTRRGESSSFINTANASAASSKQNAAAQYARMQGTAAGVSKGAYIDVFV